MKTLYFDCFSGASGNMILGALLALGIDKDELIKELSLIGIAGFELEISNVDRSGISATHVYVRVPSETVHRRLHHIEDIIGNSRLSETVKKRSIQIFTRLAEAEAKVHRIDLQKVHFHEVGAMDAIIDVVGSCIGFEMLGIEQFVCSKIHVGSGFVNMAHGKFPVPPPAVAELLIGIPIYSTEIEGELITPTGAAVIASVCNSYGQIPEMSIEQTAYGAGTREYDGFPNVLRLMIGESDDFGVKKRITSNEQLTLLETNIDDVSPQVLGFVMERAFDLGSLDCWFTPIQMKKNRPAIMLSVLCGPAKSDTIKEMIYRETTTIGVRIRQIDRECLPREIVKVSTQFGDIDVKIARIDGEIVNAMPEYDQVKRVAAERSLAFRTVRDAAIMALNLPCKSSGAEA